jgi:hypothetical protein
MTGDRAVRVVSGDTRHGALYTWGIESRTKIERFGVGLSMNKRFEHRDVRDFFTAAAEHTCAGRQLMSKDEKGSNTINTFIGFACSCGAHFLLPLLVVKCVQAPLRPYIRTTEAREETARRLTADPQALLSELRNSGGWAQPDPGVVLLTLAAAASGPKGNPMERKLHLMMKGHEEPLG